MITLTQDEVNALNILTQNAANLEVALKNAVAAQKAVIALIEVKYNAVFDEKIDEFMPKEAEEINANP